jgi:phospholipid/cholesterol/gamma-HCH transport system permease protein
MSAAPVPAPVPPKRVNAEQVLADMPLARALSGAGEMGSLAVRTARTAVTPPFPWLRDWVLEYSIALRRCIIPLSISISLYLIGFGVLVFGTVLLNLGVAERISGGLYIASVREVATWITMMVFAGIAGSAITADLGARKTREELDARSVLGVDSVRALVVPRVLATTAAGMSLALLALLMSQIALYLTAPSHLGFSPGVYRDNAIHNVIPSDLYASLIKHAFLGFFVGVVACHKGLTSRGGAEGVGRAVNQTVVIAFFGIWAFNSMFQLAYLTLFPQSSVLRG